MIDLHIHAPQYTFRGTGMDLELLEWLETNTFPEEAKYKDVLYANEAYAKFAKNLKHSSTTRACVFGTIHRRSTLVSDGSSGKKRSGHDGRKSEYGQKFTG